MILSYVVLALVVFGSTDVFGSEMGDWTAAITELLERHRDHFNANNAKALASDYEADGHRLSPGKMVIVGREAIEDSYRADIGKYSMKKMEMTDLRFACGDGAVAEYMFDDGLEVGKGVILVKMVDGVAKISTLIYNMNS